MPQTKIGAARFELATSRPPAVRATKLRHTPSVPMNTGTSYIMQFFREFVKHESAQTPAFMVTVRYYSRLMCAECVICHAARP